MRRWRTARPTGGCQLEARRGKLCRVLSLRTGASGIFADHALEQPAEKIVETERPDGAAHLRAWHRHRRPATIGRVPSRAMNDSSFRYALYDGVSSGSEDGSPVGPLMGGFTEFDGGVTRSTLAAPVSGLLPRPRHDLSFHSEDSGYLRDGAALAGARRCARRPGLRSGKADLAVEGDHGRGQDDH